MKNKKKRNKENLIYINKFREVINSNKNNIWNPSNYKLKKLNLNSFFKSSYYEDKKNNKINYIKDSIPKNNKFINSLKIEIKLNKEQKEIINKWFNSYQHMYNETLRFIKKRRIQKEKTILDFKIIRTNYLKQTKENIKNDSFINKNNKLKINSHSLDSAIKLACSNYKSALTNLRNGNIKYFRIRYWKMNRNNKIIKFENNCFQKDKKTNKIYLLPKILGLTSYFNEGIKFNLPIIKSEVTLQYNKILNKYYMNIPLKNDCEKIISGKKIISLDPGLRTFMTGLSENEVLKIGTDVFSKIKKHLNIIDKRNSNEKISNKLKKKNEKIYNRKILNLVNELHWKTIKYLTDKYETILVGNMSSKRIVSNKNSVLNKMTKRIAINLSFYKFRSRLEYKCMSKNKVYKLIDEKYTSKMCSECGFLKEDLGGNKIYKCDFCKKEMDRDVNGCRGIFFKQFM